MDEKIEKAIEPLIKMYEQIENDLLTKIASHFSINEEFLNSDHWRIKKLEEMGLFNQEIIEYLAKYTEKTPNEIKIALEKIKVDATNIEHLTSMYEEGKLKINPEILKNNHTIISIVKHAYDELSARFIEMSSKIEKATREAYLDVVESAYLKISMGTHSYQEAIRTAINDLSNDGINTLVYKTLDDNGNITGIRNYDIEGAIRRETLTAARQLSNNISLEVAEQLESEYLYLSEHLQCRPTHFDWQGTVIKREDLVEVTHYGEIDGLAGINCRHYVEPYFGDAREDELKHFNKEECTEAYNLSQKQRYLERGVRKWKRKANMFKANKDEEALYKCNVKVVEWQNRLNEFTSKRDFSREYVSNYKQVHINTKPTKNNITILKEAGILVDDSLGKMNQSLLKRNANQLKRLSQKYDMKEFFESNNTVYNCTNANYIGAVGYDESMTTMSINSSIKYFKDVDTIIDVQKKSIESKWSMPCKQENYDIYAMTHEFGHTLEIKLYKTRYPLGTNDKYIEFCREVKSDIIEIAKNRYPKFDYESSLSTYGHRNAKEFFAEVFANMELGTPNELGDAMNEYLKKIGVLK